MRRIAAIPLSPFPFPMWQGIHGHDTVVDQFRQSRKLGRLASSFLFLGPPGVGKRTFSLKLAHALLCRSADSTELDPCGQCESCRLAEAGNHPDIDYVCLPDGKRWLAVEQFIGDRDHRNQVGLCHNVSLRPLLGRRRVAIIDDADHLTTESANCLLKTLEEPPLGAVLILIGTSRSRQLPTILSRTVAVRFRPLPTEVVCQLLLEHEIAADAAQAEQLAAASGGSLQRAAELADPAVAELRQILLPRLDPARFDSVRLAADFSAIVNQAGKEANARRQRLRAIFQLVGGHFRQILLDGASTAATQEIALEVLDRCLETETQLDRNANQATLLECWLDDLAELVTSRSAATESVSS